jgi:glyoxylase I family protein
MKLEHVAINVEDPKAMANWYVKNLDMQVVRSTDQPPYMTFLADKEGQSMIEIYHNTDAGVPEYADIHPQNLHFAFAVTDMEGIRQRLIDAGATPEGEVATTPAGDRLAFLRDPWNVVVQLVQRKTPML